MLFFLFFFLFMGAVFYFSGVYVKKNPYSQINKDIWLSNKNIPAEAIELSAKKMSWAGKLLGIFYAVFAFVQLLIDSSEVSFVALLAPLMIFIRVYIE